MSTFTDDLLCLRTVAYANVIPFRQGLAGHTVVDKEMAVAVGKDFAF